MFVRHVTTVLLAAALGACAWQGTPQPPSTDPPTEIRTVVVGTVPRTSSNVTAIRHTRLMASSETYTLTTAPIDENGSFELLLPSRTDMMTHAVSIQSWLDSLRNCDGLAWPDAAVAVYPLALFEVRRGEQAAGYLYRGHGDPDRTDASPFHLDLFFYSDGALTLDTAARCEQARFDFDLRLTKGWNEVRYTRQRTPDGSIHTWTMGRVAGASWRHAAALF